MLMLTCANTNLEIVYFRINAFEIFLDNILHSRSEIKLLNFICNCGFRIQLRNLLCITMSFLIVRDSGIVKVHLSLPCHAFKLAEFWAIVELQE